MPIPTALQATVNRISAQYTSWFELLARQIHADSWQGNYYLSAVMRGWQADDQSEC